MGYKNIDKRGEYAREWVAKRRAEFFNSKRCEKCGSCNSLELDHVDRTSKVSHRIWSWSSIRREAEISKCQILCAACHKEKTVSEISRPITHGNSGYDRACRCAVCRSAHSNRMKLRVR